MEQVEVEEGKEQGGGAGGGGGGAGGGEESPAPLPYRVHAVVENFEAGTLLKKVNQA